MVPPPACVHGHIRQHLHANTHLILRLTSRVGSVSFYARARTGVGVGGYAQVTLLISNAAAMEALPIFLDAIVPDFAAIILSTTITLFFGEILPQVYLPPPPPPFPSALPIFTPWRASSPFGLNGPRLCTHL